MHATALSLAPLQAVRVTFVGTPSGSPEIRRGPLLPPPTGKSHEPQPGLQVTVLDLPCEGPTVNVMSAVSSVPVGFRLVIVGAAGGAAASIRWAADGLEMWNWAPPAAFSRSESASAFLARTV